MPTVPAAAVTPAHGKTSTLLWLALLLVAVLTYVLGLGGQYVPSNGDELVYTHIARKTAESGHWLPLVSELEHMRNTKPPLLFWQAMVVGAWGDNWTLTALRAPSVVYTLLLAAAVALILRRWSKDIRIALLGACIYLAFFCTFRFGRTYLTSAPETFWLNLPMFWLLWSSLGAPASTAAAAPDFQPIKHATGSTADIGWLAHLGFGVAMGLGLAYKSFALIAPAAATLWCAELVSLPVLNRQNIMQITLKVTLSATLALAIFGLWFVLDPDPRAVWQEFIVNENANKLRSSAGYWHTAVFGGGFSVWAQALGYVQNAGLLAGVVLGLMVLGLRRFGQRWRGLAAPTPLRLQVQVLLIWLGVWLLVFTLPSQRSARYLIDAMPALAMLMALYWSRITRAWFVPSLLLCALFMAVLGRIGWAEQALNIASQRQLCLTELMVALGLAVVLLGLLKPAWTRACTLVATLGVFAVFGLATAPLNGPSGLYSPASMAALRHQRVAVPSSFNGQFERFEFLLPGNHFVPYDGDALAFRNAIDNANVLKQLLTEHDAVVWLQTRAEGSDQPLCVPRCTVQGQRWEVKGRHQSGEITFANVWYPEQWLFRREWLLTNAAR